MVPDDRGLLDSSAMVELEGRNPNTAKEYKPLHPGGWTFQEAELSRRAVFASIFQPYRVRRPTRAPAAASRISPPGRGCRSTAAAASRRSGTPSPAA
ncbi:uncharacterized protein ColSpa_12835 [Colletotrichum spaethianum]|uniref:Uncharacterized protein n=1 Tax=Colletotrichum spaethianum TaxID=700344 RepID=A0AA37PI34_9PEZI|nr:uncharacterized protein ColSpa_12835 [Colletotrichum spaethianum]GKT52654.1 hypothetical protein ColSpa_12835 [Colletotrichum spaethianum]